MSLAGTLDKTSFDSPKAQLLQCTLKDCEFAQARYVHQQQPLLGNCCWCINSTPCCYCHCFVARKALVIMQENYRKDMTLKEAEVTALTTLKEVMEEKVGTQSS